MTQLKRLHLNKVPPPPTTYELIAVGTNQVGSAETSIPWTVDNPSEFDRFKYQFNMLNNQYQYRKWRKIRRQNNWTSKR